MARALDRPDRDRDPLPRLFARPVAATLPVLAIATVACNIYQAVWKAVRAAA